MGSKIPIRFYEGASFASNLNHLGLDDPIASLVFHG